MTIIWTSDEFCRSIQLLLPPSPALILASQKMGGSITTTRWKRCGSRPFLRLNWDEKSAIFMEKYRCHIIGDTSVWKKITI